MDSAAGPGFCCSPDHGDHSRACQEWVVCRGAWDLWRGVQRVADWELPIDRIGQKLKEHPPLTIRHSPTLALVGNVV